MRMSRRIRLDSLTIHPHRQRSEFDEIRHQELIASIEANGLLQPLVVREEGGGWTLVAGERRVRALRELFETERPVRHDGVPLEPGTAPAVSLGELDPLAAEEAEYEENVRRVDLTWDEQVQAEARLVDLRRRQADAKEAPQPTLRDLATEIRGEAKPHDVTSVSESLTLARNLHRPEVKGAKSKKEALKALRLAEQSERNAALAAKLGPEFLGSQHRVLNDDSFVWMKAAVAAGEEFDVILTDPPYGMGADNFGDSGGHTGGTGGSHFYEDNSRWVEDNIPEFFRLAFSLTREDAHLYCFLDLDWWHQYRVWAAAAGWRVFRTPLIWYKPSAYRAPWPEQGPQRKYEICLYAVKGELKCTKLGGDVLTYSPDENLGHAAQKPVALFQDLLSRSVRPGSRVLDPFCGTGPVFEAAHTLKAIATGIELDAGAYAIAARRVAGLVAGPHGSWAGTSAADFVPTGYVPRKETE